MAYTVLSVILMSAILIFNRIKSVRSESPLDPLTLLEKTPQEYKLLALSVEEMCDYVIDNRDSLPPCSYSRRGSQQPERTQEARLLRGLRLCTWNEPVESDGHVRQVSEVSLATIGLAAAFRVLGP